MSSFYYEVLFSSELSTKLTSTKSNVLELLALAYSNKNIAQECGLSVKAIEHHIRELAHAHQARTEMYNQRIRILANLYFNELIDFRVSLDNLNISQLNQRLIDTLTLIIIGLSLKSMAAILGISIKAVEQRISQLYDFFNIDTDNAANENSRVVLWVAAITRTSLDRSSLTKLFKETNNERLPRILESPDLFLLKMHGFKGVIG